MHEIFIIPLLMAIFSGWAGGSMWPSQYLDKYKLTWLPELLFIIPICWATYHLIGYWCILCGIWSYLWKQTGHANALPWGNGNHNPSRTNTLSPVVKWICDLFGVSYYSKNFARIFMGVKGFLISLPVGGLGLIGYPLGYEIGKNVRNHLVSELVSGFNIGVCVVLFYLMVNR